MKCLSLILLMFLASCSFVGPLSEDIGNYNQKSAIIISYDILSEKYDYRDWKILHDMDRGYIYDEWMEPYGPVCSFGDFKVYRWVGLPKVYDTLHECLKARRLL